MSTLERVGNGVWRLSFLLPNPTNVWFADDGQGLTLIDAALPWCGTAILRAVARIGRPLRRLVLTHAHPDHAGSMAFLARAADIEVLAHEADVPYLTGRASMDAVPGNPICRLLLRLGRWTRLLTPPTVPHVTPLREGDLVGGLLVLHTPGHTPGSLTLWDPQRDMLYCGDNVVTTFGVVHLGLNLFTLDVRARNRSVARCLDLPARLLLPGHGRPYRGDVARTLRRLLG